MREGWVGLAYQRVLRARVYSALHVPPLFKRYFDEEDELFRGRVVLKPSITATCWSIDTHLPAAFEEKERR